VEFNHYKQLHPKDLKEGMVVKIGPYAWSGAVITQIKQKDIGNNKYWYITIVRPHLDASHMCARDNWFTRFEIFEMVESDDTELGRWPWVSVDTIKHPRIQ
jgi:hypothetical protein